MSIISQKGQALVEAIVALSAAALTVSVVTILVVNALSDTSFAKAQTASAAYAKQGLEWARTKRDQNYSTFTTTYTGTWCLDKNNFATSGSCQQTSYIDGVFKRELSFTPSSPSCDSGTQVTSTVSWTDGQCSGGALCHSIVLYSCLSNNNAFSP